MFLKNCTTDKTFWLEGIKLEPLDVAEYPDELMNDPWFVQYIDANKIRSDDGPATVDANGPITPEPEPEPEPEVEEDPKTTAKKKAAK